MVFKFQYLVSKPSKTIRVGNWKEQYRNGAWTIECVSMRSIER